MLKEIAQRLNNESWPLVDATLREFGVQTSDSWNGTIESYVLAMITGIPDKALLEMAQYVGYEFEQGGPLRLAPPFWQKGFFRLFISHLAAHKVFAAALQAVLLEYGISSFVAHTDIEPTLEWQTEIETALSTCDTLIALLHEKFHESNWTDQEIGFAMGRGVPAYSVRLGQAPYGFIARFQAFNGHGKSPRDLAHELFDSFRTNKQTQRRMGEALVKLFEESDTFAAAKTRIRYLEELESWEPSFSARIQSASETNRQIYDSYGIPERVAALVKKRGT